MAVGIISFDSLDKNFNEYSDIIITFGHFLNAPAANSRQEDEREATSKIRADSKLF